MLDESTIAPNDGFCDLDPDLRLSAPVHAKAAAARPAKSTFVEVHPVEFSSPTLKSIWEQPNHHEAADRLYRSRIGIGPIVEPIDGEDSQVLVTILYQGDKDTRSIILSGGPADWEWPMSRFGRTHLWFLSASVPKASRFAYTFNEEVFSWVNGREGIVLVVDLIDESNPHLASNGCSVLALPWAPPLPSTAKGRAGLPVFEIESHVLGEHRLYSLYSPPPASGPNAGVVVFFDGEAFATGWPQHEVGPFVDMPAILDQLIAAGKIPPIFAAFVHVGDRRYEDLTGSTEYADFVALELLPSIQNANALASSDAAKTIVAGSSLGGVCAAACALRHSDIIGNVLSISGSFWLGINRRTSMDPFFGECLIQTALLQSPLLPIRFYLEVGTYEGQAFMVLPNRAVRDILLAKGYCVTYRELPGNHDYMRWQISMCAGLIDLTSDWK